MRFIESEPHAANNEHPSHQRVAIPAHKNLAVGTLGNILRAIADHKGVTREEILGSLR